MTSQIAIFNPLGVAVASDTVATLSSPAGVKTTSNTEKLWPLTDDHLVTVALSGSPISCGVHVRLLISEWNKSLIRPLPTLQHYAENFWRWLTAEKNLIPTDMDQRVIVGLLEDHFRFVRTQVVTHARENNSSDEQVAEYFVQAAEESFEYLNELNIYEGATDFHDAQILNSVHPQLSEQIDHLFSDFPGLPQAKASLLRSAPLVLSRIQPMPTDSEIAFIGFGSEEHFAQSIRMRYRGRYGNLARVKLEQPFGIQAGEESGSMTTFAQNDAIMGFVRGAQFDVISRIKDFAFKWTVNNSESYEMGINRAEELVNSLDEFLNDYQQQNFISPMLDTIGALNLRDAAELAESLVGIQAMRSNASPHPAGVGGFIESLIIDRIDGIRWINRLPR